VGVSAFLRQEHPPSSALSIRFQSVVLILSDTFCSYTDSVSAESAFAGKEYLGGGESGKQGMEGKSAR
jgi:hypothetical protein